MRARERAPAFLCREGHLHPETQDLEAFVDGEFRFTEAQQRVAFLEGR